MANNGVPDTVVSARAGHSDLSFTKPTYVHPPPTASGRARRSARSCSAETRSTAFVRSCEPHVPETPQGLVSH
ncbi:hypothetical protein [Actinacidiphila yeochonensis]|uniref:hypothetical protein n=1 Tax=Actinacidiphila yeochonensis TaxID=89050 RepID=UPI00099DFAC7